MPYADPQAKREAKARQARARRARQARQRDLRGPTLTALAGADTPPLTAESIAAIVARALHRAERELHGAEHARAIAALASVALRALEARELDERLRALERAVREVA